jgi:hypothetical protein
MYQDWLGVKQLERHFFGLAAEVGHLEAMDSGALAAHPQFGCYPRRLYWLSVAGLYQNVGPSGALMESLLPPFA